MQKIGHWTIYSAVLFIVLSVVIGHYPHQIKADSVIDFQEGPPAAPAAAPAPVSDSAGQNTGPAPAEEAASQPAEAP